MQRLSRLGPCDGVSIVGGGVRMEGFDINGVDLNVVGFGKMLGWFSFEVVLKGFSGVVDAFDVEESCLLICSGKVLFISSRSIASGCRTVGVFICCLKLRYLSCNWKYRFAFSSLLRSVRERISTILSCTSSIAGSSGSADRFWCFRYRKSSFEKLPCISAWLNLSSLDSTFVRSLQLSGVVVFKSTRR